VRASASRPWGCRVAGLGLEETPRTVRIHAGIKTPALRMILENVHII
jgi:hypothetical protein